MEEKLRYIDGYTFAETVFSPQELAKTESIMALGNGYLGLRASAEETYAGQSRGLFVAGTFNRFGGEEVTELPNAADIVETAITLDGVPFDLSLGSVANYEKKLDLRRGLLTRRADWAVDGKRYSLSFSRFVAAHCLHTVGQEITIRAGQATNVTLVAGINGRSTNSGAQHFTEGDKRFVDKTYLQMSTRTTQSGVRFFYAMGLQLFIDGQEATPEPVLLLDRRRIRMELAFTLQAGQTARLVKFTDVRTDMDADSRGLAPGAIRQAALAGLRANRAAGFAAVLAASARALAETLWAKAPVAIESGSPFDELAVHFAQYHLHAMTPAHDARMNIGAKGLAGEGYKGHTFWDTEIFLLPYFILTSPETARSLLEYRYLSLGGARRKAAQNGYRGAMFPWESAGVNDGEVTPEWGPADVETGLPLRIETGFIEQHITADVAFGVWQYYLATGDEAFMLACGYELVFETAKFWASRLEYSSGDGLYHINDVMGPDEFKEHVDDNAYTNYMAWWNLRLALRCGERLAAENPAAYARLAAALGLEAARSDMAEKAGKLYLPGPGPGGVLPQDKTYLTLPDIDLAKYKAQSNVGGIYRDYSSRQISSIQVSKQADVMLLVLLLEELFPDDVKRASWQYYEPRTLHDSSLSLSTHAILAGDMGMDDTAYALFQRACRVDLGQNMHSCDDGVHAAAMGGIWQAAVLGFGGVRITGGGLRIAPRLPRAWRRLAFTVCWRGQRLAVAVTHTQVSVESMANSAPVEFTLLGETVCFDGSGRPASATAQLPEK